MKHITLLCFAIVINTIALAQQDSIYTNTLESITVAAGRWQQQVKDVPVKIVKIPGTQSLFYNPQTTADLLSQSGQVFIQKSQLGGGSPMIRGFATNRVLLVVDGIRMNNAIFRSGNLQNIISIDALSIQNAEIVFGPSSIMYGSDAIGGVMHFSTLEPLLSNNNKLKIKGSTLARYSSANNENTIHADMNVGGKKWAFTGAFTYSKFGDLKMGKHGGDDSYLRNEYVERIDNKDSIVKNGDPRIQRFSGYTQQNYLAKIRFKLSDKTDLQYQFTYGITGDAPRYDRLIQYRNGKLRFAEWNYGPMIWQMHSVHALIEDKLLLADKIKITAAYQLYEESRKDRSRGSNTRTIQAETVNAYSINIDAMKRLSENMQFFYGLEYVYNGVGSTGIQQNITNANSNAYVSRYPDGSKWSTAGIYVNINYQLHKKLKLIAGLRYSANMLKANFDTTFIKFPYQSVDLKKGNVTGSFGVVYSADETLQLSANMSTGYRMPNVDDMGKLFESAPGNVTVPNIQLKPEYAWNFEAGIAKSVAKKYNFEVNVFYTILNDAIVRRPSTFNGKDSIEFGGVKSRVESLQNVAKATVWGLQTGLRVYLSSHLHFQTYANWVSGKETDDTKNEQVSLRHAPPFYGSTHLHFKKAKWRMELYAMYNSSIANKNLAPSEQAKTDIYAKDANGLPYSPAWFTVNIKSAYQLNSNFSFTVGWENITNQRYRPYSSGIVAAGSNVIMSIRASF